MFKIEKIENVHIYTDQSRDGYFNNVTIIEQESGLTVIDTFKKTETMNALLEHVRQYNKRIERVIFTHWHIDHTLGAYFLRDTDIYSSLECKKKLLEFREKYQEEMITKGIMEKGLSVVMPNIIIDEKLSIPMDDDRALLIETFPGHSHDGIVIHYKNMLIVGDILVGREVEVLLPPAIPPDAPKSKPEDLFVLLNYIEQINPEYVIYGHGERLPPQVIINDNRERLLKIVEKSS